MELKKNKKMFWYSLIYNTFIFTFLFVSVAFADPGVNAGNWIVKQIEGIVFAIVACAAAYFLVKNQFISLFKYIVLAILALFLIYSPVIFQSEGNTLVRTILGW